MIRILETGVTNQYHASPPFLFESCFFPLHLHLFLKNEQNPPCHQNKSFLQALILFLIFLASVQNSAEATCTNTKLDQHIHSE